MGLKLEGEGLELAGKVDAQIHTIGFPTLVRGNILVIPETDERYDIQQIQRSEIKSFPIQQICACAKLPVSDIVYRLPIPSYRDLADPVSHAFEQNR